MKIENITCDGILTAIYAVRADDPSPNLGFTCDPQTYCDVMLIHDGDGHLVTRAPHEKGKPQTLFGYPVDIDAAHDGLVFGRISPKQG